MKLINQYINEAKSNEFSIYFNYDKNSIAIHKYGDGNNSDKTGFKTIDEAVKTIYSKEDKNAHISIIPSDKLTKYILEY